MKKSLLLASLVLLLTISVTTYYWMQNDTSQTKIDWFAVEGVVPWGEMNGVVRSEDEWNELVELSIIDNASTSVPVDFSEHFLIYQNVSGNACGYEVKEQSLKEVSLNTLLYKIIIEDLDNCDLWHQFPMWIAVPTPYSDREITFETKTNYH